MTGVMEHCDDNGMEHCDVRGMEHWYEIFVDYCDDSGHGELW